MKIEVSNGEIVDKCTIAQIKYEQITDADLLEKVKTDLDKLTEASSTINMREGCELYDKLLSINRELWKIEDAIREKESNKEFDDKFIGLARQVYITNDKRSQLKKEIDKETNSNIQEVKSYKEW